MLYNFKIFENSSSDSFLGQVIATDKDDGEFGEITYSLVGDWLLDHFHVDSTTGREH